MRNVIMSLALIGAAALGAGCPDTEGEFEEFLDRSAPYNAVPVAGECTSPLDLSGDYLLSVSLSASPGTPVLFRAEFTVDLGAQTITASITAAKSADRSDSGETYTTSSPLAADGSYSLDFGRILVPGDANFLGSDVEADIVFEGCTSTTDFTCGAVSGDVVSPPVSLAGSTYGVDLLVNPEDIGTAEIVSTCPTPE